MDDPLKAMQDTINQAQFAAQEAKPGQAGEQSVKEKVIEVMKTVYDPEIPVNVWELGLVYDIRVDADAAVVVQMTLTSPMCPVAGSLPPEVEHKVRAIPGVTSAKVDLVWDPPWNPSMMSEAAKLQLNMY
jgi:FeS assembly SUF system protein